ncbi:ribokinase [Aequitasia blattaphilus]|uniref:Ribokinase n=1 Tax=Aequitasia blattaphilus TaxID=2949332 RepID=A0ABT1EA28_9FIRM|nr:ribokinase [Aequitasia blattaphilus]MCP1102695.1 ribokinase [Aequitasia blattaphilus]MCR8615335.1 ribokinase [Aequitasia blattaphilus]
MSKPKILVVGSMNMDAMIYGVPKIPDFGESVLCRYYAYVPGGKGSNQAMAAAFQGADVTMVGRVGDDDNGYALVNDLKKAGVDTQFIVFDPDEQTGFDPIMVDESGKYVSYVVMGANDKLDFNQVRSAIDAKDYDMVVMQLEMPLETVYKTYEYASEKGIRVFLDAGPAQSISLERLKNIFIISPNEAETKALTGIDADTEEKAIAAAKKLYDEVKPKHVILKMGCRGALLYNENTVKIVPCFKVNALDSTAAGDTFGAALAIQLCKGEGMETAIRFAHAAAGICVSRKGAQTSIPTEEEVIAFLKRYEKEEVK